MIHVKPVVVVESQNILKIHICIPVLDAPRTEPIELVCWAYLGEFVCVSVLVRKMPLDDVLHSAHDAGRSNVGVGGSCIRYCEEANYKRNM